LAVLAAAALGLLRPFGRPRPLVWLRERRTLIQRMKGERSTSRLWTAALRPTLRHPALAVALAAGLLLVMASPLLGIRTKLPSFTDLPRSVPVVRSFEEVQRAFPGAQSPAVVVVQAADVDAPSVRRAIGALEHAALASGRMSGPIDVRVNAPHTAAVVEI